MHVHSYLACLERLPGVTVAGLYDDDAERGKETAARFGLSFYSDAERLLDLELDGVIVASENVKHLPLVALAAPRTGHILCEKPIATTLEDANRMIALCRDHGTKLQIAFPVRFAPPAQRLKEMIGEVLDSPRMGRPLSVKCSNHGKMPGGWFTDRSLSGGGAVIDHTVHVIDLLRWFFGAEVKEVYAEVGEGLLHPDLGIDDAGLLSFTLDNGLYGTLDTSWSRPQSYPTWGDVKIQILSERGVVRADIFRQHLAVTSDRLGRTEWVHWGTNADMGLIKDFTAMISEGREPSITGEDGLKALEVALAAYRSAAIGEPVTLGEQS
jgi:predicted dehydrogenase